MVLVRLEVEEVLGLVLHHRLLLRPPPSPTPGPRVQACPTFSGVEVSALEAGPSFLVGLAGLGPAAWAEGPLAGGD